MSYEETITAWANAARQRVLEDVKWLTKATQFNIVVSTPIDTGRAKSSWNIAAGENADLSVTPELAGSVNSRTGILINAVAGASPLTRSQAHTAATAQHQVVEALTEPVATISNNLHYILSLEQGKSQQAGPGAMFVNNVFMALDEARQMGYTARIA